MGEMYWPVKLLAVVVILALAGVFAWQRYLSPEAEARRSGGALYRLLPTYPGASVQTRSTVYAAGDSCSGFWFLRSCGSYSLVVVYRLPSEVGVDEAKAFYLANLRDGWYQATDDACVFPFGPPPGASPPPAMRLVVPENQLLLQQRAGKLVTIVFDEHSITIKRGGWGCVPK